jgi:hypothetical protein
LKHVTRSFGKGAHLLVIESIPMWSCPSGGESRLTAHTTNEVERIKDQGSLQVSRQAAQPTGGAVRRGRGLNRFAAATPHPPRVSIHSVQAMSLSPMIRLVHLRGPSNVIPPV